MSEVRTEKPAEPLVSINLAVPDDKLEVRTQDNLLTTATPDNGAGQDGQSGSDAKPSQAQAADEGKRKNAAAVPSTQNSVPNNGEKSKATKPKKVSPAKVQMQSRLPALEDDADIGVEKEHIVTRDGKADLMFMGTLLASAAPTTAPHGSWQEYRIYLTNGDKHVFSKVSRNTLEDEEDTHEAEVFDPAPSSIPSHLMRSAREIARAKPLTWMDSAVSFFGYDPLAKDLYRKLDVRFEEQIT